MVQASNLEKVSTNPISSFENLTWLDECEQNDREVMAYREASYVPVSDFESQGLEKQLRPGCEYETTIR